ncbi:MAG: hypothetical protein JW395_1682 [Nitrospira sp.]|nr:hypothetical protein [Nitrospira sp.]
MLKQILLGLGAASLLVVVTAMPVQAEHLPLPWAGPLPDYVIVTRGAWEWVWVSPCVERDGSSCSFGTEDYGFAAPVGTTPWTESFTGYSDMLTAFTFIDSNNPSSPLRCAAPYFSQDYEDCQDGDLTKGLVFQGPFQPQTNPTVGPGFLNANPNAEVFWVRAASVPAPLPEPSSLLLLGAGLLGLAAWRWKHSA